MDWTPETLGPWLREMRERAGFSLDALGERVGRTRQQLIDYEKGRREPSGVVLMKILTEVGAKIDAPTAVPGVSSLTGELERLATTIDVLTGELTRPQPAEPVTDTEHALATAERVLDAVQAQTRLFVDQFLGVHAALRELLEAATLPPEDLDADRQASLADRREELQRLQSQLERWRRAG